MLGLLAAGFLLIGSSVQASQESPPALSKYLLRMSYGDFHRYGSFGPWGSFFLNDFALDKSYRGEIQAIRIRHFPHEAGVLLRILLFKEPYHRYATMRQLDEVPQDLITEFVLSRDDKRK